MRYSSPDGAKRNPGPCAIRAIPAPDFAEPVIGRRFAPARWLNPGYGKSLRLKISRLRRGQRREFAAVGVQVDQWRFGEAIEAAHQDFIALDADQLDDRGADRVRPHRRAQREGAARRFVVLRALQHEIAARLMEPVDHFEIAIEIDSLQRRHPGLENFEPAHRTVMTALPRRLQTRGPRRADAADEHQPSVARRRHLDGDFPFADFTFSNHVLQSTMSLNLM